MYALWFKAFFFKKKYTAQYCRMLPQKKILNANGNSFIKYIGWFGGP